MASQPLPDPQILNSVNNVVSSSPVGFPGSSSGQVLFDHYSTKHGSQQSNQIIDVILIRSALLHPLVWTPVSVTTINFSGCTGEKEWKIPYLFCMSYSCGLQEFLDSSAMAEQ